MLTSPKTFLRTWDTSSNYATWLPGRWDSIPSPGEKQEALCALLHSSCLGPNRPQDVFWGVAVSSYICIWCHIPM